MLKPSRKQVLAAAVGLLIVSVTWIWSAAADDSQELRITLVYDNTVFDERLEADWGFAALIEYRGHTILFDTGASGPLLMENMQKLGIDPGSIELIVISHEHGDHIGGLFSFFATGLTPPVYVPIPFPNSLRDSLRSRTELIEVAGPLEILPGLYSTGSLTGPPMEQALVIDTGTGIVVITGCAHPAIVRIVTRAKTLLPGEVELVVGGFHLHNHDVSMVRQIAGDLRALGVHQVCPAHCTGEEAIDIFSMEYGHDFLRGGAGRIFVLPCSD